MMASSSSEPVDVTRWVVFYPIYINSKKTIAEGRRISSSQGVENPTVAEILDCCNYLKLPCIVERRYRIIFDGLPDAKDVITSTLINHTYVTWYRTGKQNKAYSRDFMQRGRLRVQLKTEDGLSVNPAVPTRKALMVKVAELIPKHQGRTKKGGDTATASGATATTGKSGKSSKKKK